MLSELNGDDLLFHDYKRWQDENDEPFIAFPKRDDNFKPIIREWLALLPGITGTPQEDAFYWMELKFTENYPFEPPMVIFSPSFYHPNVNNNGTLVNGVLKAPQQGQVHRIIKDLLIGSF